MSADPNDLWNNDDDDEETPPAADKSQLEQLRQRADQAAKLEKQNRKLAEQLEELSKFKQEQEGKARITSAESVLPDEFKGLADVFAEKTEGELTAEAANAFLQARGLAPKPAEAAQAPAPAFNPTVAGDQPSPQKITRAQIDELFKKDPKQAAVLLMQEGRAGNIEWNNPEGVAQTLRGADVE